MDSVRFLSSRIVLLCLFFSGTAFGQTAINTIAHQPDPVEPYTKLEITFTLGRAYVNTYNTDEVDARVEFVPPGGDPMIIPAFWYLGYNRVYSGGTENYYYDGTATWMARLMPRVEGTYSYRVLVTDSGGDSASDWQTFECSGPGKPGFIQVDPRNPVYLRYENGEPYYPVGHNLCWPGGGGAHRAAEWLTKMEAAGENWTRYWMVPYVGQGLEWTGMQYLGLGKYTQLIASRFDGMIDAAGERGVAVQLCLDSFNGWNQTTYANWEENPYNTARGGMLSAPIEYFSNPQAKSYAKKRFRYIVARWAYSPAVLCWELWNEVDLMEDYGTNTAASGDWHREMAQYIRSIDPYNHMITTSFAFGWDHPEVWAIPEMDIVQVHRYYGYYPGYSPRYHMERIEQAKVWGKPVVLGEYGLWDVPSSSKPIGKSLDPGGALLVGPQGSDEKMVAYVDSNGDTIHDAIWPAAMIGSSAMSWWWDNWIDPDHLYPVYEPLVDFLAGEDWAPHYLRDLDAAVLSPHSMEVYGSQGEDHAFLWVKDELEGWVSGLQIRLNGMQDGELGVEYWDTATGSVVTTEVVTISGGSTVLTFPGFSRDMAVKVKGAPAATHHWMLYR